MRTAIDYSSARPAPATLKAAGVEVVCRYLTRASGPKCLTATEAFALHAAGIAVAPNFEDAADNALKGASQGTLDARFANHQADGLGIPAGVWIWYSCDTGATFGQVAPYYRAAKAAGGRPVAFYGPLGVGLELMAENTVVGVWVTDAAAWSGYSSWSALATAARASSAHMLQHLDHPLTGIDPGSYDLDEILRTFPVWGPTIEKEIAVLIPRRVASTVVGREAFITFDAATKTLTAYNGAEFAAADPKVWKVTRGFGVVVAQLLLASSGTLDYADSRDGTAVVITAAGDGGTFRLPYAKVEPLPAPPAPAIDVKAVAAQVAGHLSLKAS